MFYADYNDMQFQQFINATTVIGDAASATLQGVEAEALAHVTSRLTVNLAYAYLDAEYGAFAPGKIPVDGATGQFRVLDGHPLPNAPENSVNLNVTYRQPMPSLGGELIADANVHWQSRTYEDPLAFETESQAPYSISNFRLGDGLEVSAFVNNAFDEDYYVNIIRTSSFLGGPYGVAGAPPTFGVEVKINR